jgi:4a-hydroxytetrahydrobiopterin dehydratase
MTDAEEQAALRQVPQWSIHDISGERRLVRQFQFDDFAQALAFTNKLGDLAESHNHHPLIHLTWGSVEVEWWTHTEGGLSPQDFVLASATDHLPQ